MSAFGSGPSNGQFWYGSTTNFPGFLYKKNVGVGGRRSTKMGAGGNITCNSATYLYNKYKPGQGGVGASSIANRRAKNRLATICTEQKCFPCYMTLGQYSNYTHNPNGFIPCLQTKINANTNTIQLIPGNSPANMNTSGYTNLTILNDIDDGASIFPIPNFDFKFFNSSLPLYWSTNAVLGFGTPTTTIIWGPTTGSGILLGNFDRRNNTFWYSPVLTGSSASIKYINLLYFGQNVYSDGIPNVLKYQITIATDGLKQYVQIKTAGVGSSIGQWNIANSSPSFLNTCGSFQSTGPVVGGSYVFVSDITGTDWTFYPNYHITL
jgi:hypothetical protein